MLQRIIPRTGEAIPVIGLGTWQVFDVSPQPTNEPLQSVLNTMHRSGTTLIDTSPMYGRAEETVGHLTESSGSADDFFYATKVWTTGRAEGIQQMERSLLRMKRSSLELMQIHNLVDWKVHIETLRQWKAEGKVRHIGITHYTDAAHSELEKIITSLPVDFVQFNYSITARHAERRLLRAAADCGVATLINRPLGEGRLFDKVRGKSLPSWAAEWGITGWSQFFLKFIIAHPAVTCVIPATANPQHAADNAKAGYGALPDEPTREKMAACIATL